MGNSESAGAAAASGAIQERINKEKKRAKRLGCCCCWCNFGAIVAFVVGIALLVLFAASLGDNYNPADHYNTKQPTAKGYTYTGIAFLCLGALCLIIGILFALGLYIAYKRLNGKQTSHQNFVPKKYAKGTAPYPQQDWGETADPHEPQASPVPPQQPGGPHDEASTLITPEIKQ